MIISCPHCQTRYRVAFEAIGSAGRKVQCAHCHQAWQQAPLPAADEAMGDDRLFEAMDEDALDEAMEAEALVAAPVSGGFVAPVPGPLPAAPDAAEMKKRQVAYSRRRHAMSSRQPLARVRRAARVVGAVLLAALLCGAYFGRVPLVERYPDLAGLYEAAGLGVNVVGLDFAGLETLRTLSNGRDVLMVSAQIVGRASRPVPVPPVVVSLLDASGRAVYEWSVAPRVRDLMAGERATFDTRLSLPPSEAVRVRLSFAGAGRAGLSDPSVDLPAGPATMPEAGEPY